MTDKQRKAIELLNHCNSWLYLSEEQAINDEEYMLLMDFVVDGTNRDEKKLQHVYVFHDDEDGKGTITLGHDEDADAGDAPEEELSDEEKRIRRMAVEYDELTGRYRSLVDGTSTEKFGTLLEDTLSLLKRQHQAMHDYREALRQRIRIDAAVAVRLAGSWRDDLRDVRCKM